MKHFFTQLLVPRLNIHQPTANLSLSVHQIRHNLSSELKQRIRQNSEILFLIALVTAYFMWLNWPIVWTASENIRLVSTFNIDEAIHVDIISNAIRAGTFKLEFRTYGHLFFNIVLLPLFLLSYFTPISEQQIIVSLRFVSTVFAIGTVGATFLLARRYFGHLAAWLSASLLCVVPLSFVMFSAISHPDVLQMFFLVLGIYFCCRLTEQESRKWLIWASICAGLAFAAKYSGIFLLPIIWLVAVSQTIMNPDNQFKVNTVRLVRIARYGAAVIGVICVIIGVVFTPDFVKLYLGLHEGLDQPWKVQMLTYLRTVLIVGGGGFVLLAIPRFIWSTIEQTPKLASGLNKVIISTVTFGAAFVLTSPFSLVKLNFIRGIINESRTTSFGHWFEAGKNGLLWLDILLLPNLLDVVILGLVVVSLILAVYKVSKRGWRQLLSPEVIMWTWVIFFTSYLVFRVVLRVPRHLLPVIPIMIILGTLPISWVIGYARSRLSKRLAVVLAVVVLFVIGGFEIFTSFGHIYEYRQATINREQNNDAVKAGQWLVEHYPASTRILYDVNSYVPPPFSNARSAWEGAIIGGTTQMLKAFDPDVVIIHKYRSHMYSDPRQATSYRLGENAFYEVYEYYDGFRNEKFDYVLIGDFGDFQIYAK